MNKYLCFDVGGTYVKYACMTPDAQNLAQGSYATERYDRTRFLTDIKTIYSAQTGVTGISLCVPGVIEPDTGFMRTGGSVGCLAGCYLAKEVGALCGGLPVTLENDAKAAALAEYYAGALKECKSGIVIVIGTAIGGTIILDNKILRGAHLFAGEFSYLF